MSSVEIERQRYREYAEYPVAIAKALVKAVGLSVEVNRNETMTEESRKQAGLVRDIFGTLPFRSVHIDPVLLTGPVVAIANAAYEDRLMPAGTVDTVRLAVVADALEESGCTDKDVLNHLREPDGVHVRGCWCIDLLLGKT
jgi:hypothetical protein